MVKDAGRVAYIIDRVLLLCQKGSARLHRVDINELIREMVTVPHNNAKRHSIIIRTRSS